jgi:hypothetical protein
MLTPDDFVSHVQKVFRVRGTAHAFVLTRIDQRQMEPWEVEQEGLRQPFNLIFRGPPGNVLEEGLYVLDVADGPSFELYVMPIHTPMRDQQNYQASFN